MATSLDIVDRLRTRTGLLGMLADEAADEIERLRRELAHASASYDADMAEIKRLGAEVEQLRRR